MAQSTRTFRIFVSSTFSDFKEERNALQTKVFPRLKELCAEHGCRFQAIDLRWGVSEEAGLDQRTMKICLDEIARCQSTTPRPNFIVLVGERYGWRPLPYEIPSTEFEEIVRHITDEEKGILSEWYLRDDNAVPPVYDLRPRKEEYKSFEKWKLAENTIRSILLKAIDAMELSPDDQIKYRASATEQEIIRGAIGVSDANEHVFCFFRNIEGLIPDRDAGDYFDIDNEGRIDAEMHNRLACLKDKLKERLKDNVYKYNARWSGNSMTYEHLPGFCSDAYQSLSKIISLEIKKLESASELDSEIYEHQSFCRKEAGSFIGREDMLGSIAAYIAGDSRYPLVICGPPGAGKTALMARAAEAARDLHGEEQAITRFIGTVPQSSDIISLLDGLNKQIGRSCGLEVSDTSKDFKQLSDAFNVGLRLVKKDKRLVIFLDGVDQLSDNENARGLIWLPSNLPENVRIIISSGPGDCYSVLERRIPGSNHLKIGPMTVSEGSALLDKWLFDSNRALQAWQREEVLSRFADSGLPLFLKIEFELARKWKSYSSIDECTLRADIRGIILDMLDGLSAETNHGKPLVSKSLGYIAASRNGLSEDELLDLLSSDRAVLDDFHHRSPLSPDTSRLPFIVWSRLYSDLERYFWERNVNGVRLISFYHPRFLEVITEEYLGGDMKIAMHQKLANYFAAGRIDLRMVDELPWQLSQAGDHDRLKACLVNMDLFVMMHQYNRTYELMGYWRLLGDRYDAFKEYKAGVEDYEKRGESPEYLSYCYDRIGVFFNMSGKYVEAESMLRKGLEIREKHFSADSTEIGYSLNNLAMLLDDQRKLEEAIILFQRAIAIFEKTLGPWDPQTASSLNNLGVVLDRKGDYDHSEALLRRALAIREKALGLDHFDVAQSLDNIAIVMDDRGAYKEAEALYRRALEIRENALGPENPEVAQSLNNLAVLQRETGNHAVSEANYLRALSIYQKVLGPDHPDTTLTMYNLAELYRLVGRYDEAEILFKLVLEKNRNTLGLAHPEVARSMIGLAILMKTKGNYTEGKDLMRQALGIIENSLGKESMAMADYEVILSELLIDTGEYIESEALVRRALKKYRKGGCSWHPKYAGALNNLATIMGERGKAFRSQLFHRQAYAIFENTLGPGHPDTADALLNIAVIEMNGDLVSAKAKLKQVLSVYENTFGEEHIKTANALHNIGEAYFKSGEFVEAERSYRRALSIYEKLLGPEHETTAGTLNNLAILLLTMQRFAEAEPIYFRALAICENVYGHESPRVSQMYNNIGVFYFDQKKYDEAERWFIRALEIDRKVLRPGHEETKRVMTNLKNVRKCKNESPMAYPGQIKSKPFWKFW